MRISLALILTLVALGALWTGSGEAHTRRKIFNDDICRLVESSCSICCFNEGYEDWDVVRESSGLLFCRCITYEAD